jgi:hypothetical protein
MQRAECNVLCDGLVSHEDEPPALLNRSSLLCWSCCRQLLQVLADLLVQLPVADLVLLAAVVSNLRGRHKAAS